MLAGEQRLLRGFPPKELLAVRGDNAELWDASGKRYLDMGGASHGVALLGHNHPRIVAAIQQQAAQLLHVAQTVPTPPRAAFLERLHSRLPAQLSKTFLTNSGTEAIECAIKLATVATGRTRFVAAKDSFHGRTLGSVALTHRAAFREPWQGLLLDADFAPFNDVEALKATVSQDTAAIILEPVQGEGGVRPANEEYLRAARDLATERGALLIHDEVQSGLGRTGTFLAADAVGVVPDLVALAKGLAGGLAVGSCSMTDAVAEKLPPGGHGGTYGGNPLACAAGVAALDILWDERLPQRAATIGEAFLQRIRQLEHPLVRDVRGRGFMVGIDLRVRPQPVLAALHERGILALTGGTTGIRLLPPLTTPQAHLDETLDALRSAFDASVPKVAA